MMGRFDVQPRGELGGDFGEQKNQQLSNTGRDGNDEGIEDVWAEVQSGDEEGRVEVARDVLHVVFGVQRAAQLSRIGPEVRSSGSLVIRRPSS